MLGNNLTYYNLSNRQVCCKGATSRAHFFVKTFRVFPYFRTEGSTGLYLREALRSWYMNQKQTDTETNRGRMLRIGALPLDLISSIATSTKDFFLKRRDSLLATTTEIEQLTALNAAIKQLSEASRDWSQDLLKRGGGVFENATAQSGKFTQSVLERGGQVTRDLSGRGNQVTQVLAERGDRLLQPIRKHRGTFWTIFGFSLGTVAAAVIAFVLLRKRIGKQGAGEEEHIELPLEKNLNGASSQTQGKPAGEIRHLDHETGSVATLQTVGVDVAQAVEVPANAAFAGVASTKRYYPLEKLPGEIEQDVIYFTSEDEAKALGYSAAE
jgi:hypothetical protein